MISLYYGFWDYWQLYQKVTFDGVNRYILINEGVTGSLDIQTEVYSAWKKWAQLDNNLKYTTPFAVIGGDPTVAGQFLDATYFLVNDWKFKPHPGSYNLTLIGNVYDVNGGDIKVPADILLGNPNNITINLNTSNIVRRIEVSGSSGTGGLTPEENATLYEISGSVVSIQSTVNYLSSILSVPVTASLVSSQEAILLDIQAKLNEVWQLHGLDINNPLLVTQTLRTFDTVVQSIDTIGSGSSQETTITRL